MSFNNQFTVIPTESAETELHCGKCTDPAKQVWRIGYHPSLDRVNEAATEHNVKEHNDLPAV